LINNDAIFPQGHLQKMIAALEADKQAVMAFPSVMQAGTLHTWMHYQRWLGLILSRPVPGSFPYASGCCQLIAVDRLGLPLYDESFFMYGEDVELSWRLSDGRQKIIHVDGDPVLHEGSASSGPNTAFYETQMVASQFLLAFRLASGPVEAAWLFMARMLSLGLRALLRSLRHRHCQPVVSYIAGIREALRIRNKRKNLAHH
jgi:GT2 family glycosyltransferase